MIVSVALTLFNGLKYIEEQLDSIRLQTRKPDEVFIVDDCSNDGSFKYVSEYIRQHNLSYWKIIQNPENLGWKKNFRKVIELCKGDLIFLCDQDDIWHADKIKDMEIQMKKNNSILLLASNYSVINVDRTEKVKVFGLKKNNKTIKHIKFKSKTLTLMRPGCSYCLRNKLVKILEEKDLEHQPHDVMLWKYALIYDGLYLFNSITMQYRRHSDSASTPSQLSKQRRYSEADTEISILEFFEKICRNNKMTKKADVINKHIKFITKRTDLLRANSLIKMIVFQVFYFAHYATIRNMFSDEYLILKQVRNY